MTEYSEAAALDTGMAPALEIEWVCDEVAFAALRADWNALADAAPLHSVFLRHEWFDAAWQWRKRDSTLAIICVRENGRLIGVAPLLRSRRRRHGLTARCLEFLSVPDTQFCDVLVAPDCQARVHRALSRALLNARPVWDVLTLTRLTGGGGPALCSALSTHGLPARLEASETNLYIDLTNGWPNFYAQRSRRLKKANNLVANRLQRAYPRIEMEQVTALERSRETLAMAAETAAALSARSWKKDTGMSLDQPGPGAFFRRLVDHAAGRNWLSIWLLRLDQQPAAMELQIVDRGQVYALRSDFVQEQPSLSPGTYLNWKLIESLFGMNLVRYWFGPGENSYKLHWTDIGEPLHTLTAYNRTLSGRWLAAYEMLLRPWLKRLLRRRSKQDNAAGSD